MTKEEQRLIEANYLKQVVTEAKRVWRGEYVELKLVKTRQGVHMIRSDKIKFEPKQT